MYDSITLPTYPDQALAELSPSKLTDILIENEDRVPRNVIDECAHRGDEMTKYLGMLYEDDFLWPIETNESLWWLRLHAIMILGLIPSEQSGLLLVALLRRLSLEDDDNSMQDWIAGNWPALFRNKPDSVLPALRALCEDRDIDAYLRANAVDPVIFAASRQGGEALEQALAWLAGIVAEVDEDLEFRLAAGIMLLYYPRAQYRQLLESLAALQDGMWALFSAQDVQRAYAGQYEVPEWERFENPWAFYEAEAITQRQRPWRKKEREEGDYSASPYVSYIPPETYIRPEPKVGRNDPCPCGSGKKYKKCCLAKE